MATLFDYKNQAWTVDGVYVDCGHPPVGTVMGAGSPAPGEVFQGCKCYGKAHVGESVPSEIIAEMELMLNPTTIKRWRRAASYLRGS